MAKFQDIRALAKQQLQAVTKNGECWKAFLHTAAIAYNYNFPNQLLIHCQNPTATAVADMEYWNKEAGRYICDKRRTSSWCNSNRKRSKGSAFKSLSGNRVDLI